MALLFVDGFDHYATADLVKKWTAIGVSGYQSISPAAGRRGGGALYLVSSTSPGGYVHRNVPPSSTLIVGFAYQFLERYYGSTLLVLREGALSHIHIGIDSQNTIYAAREQPKSTPTVLGTSPYVLQAGQWIYLEVRATVHDTNGAITVRVNGENVLNLSGIDTRNGGTGVIDQIMLGYTDAWLGAAKGYWDDLYVCDTTGTINNDFLGDCRVDTLFPNADGTYTDLTPSTGTSHYALVDETAPNATDFNSSGTVGARDSYAFQDLQALASQTVYGVQVNAALHKDDAGSRSAAPFARSGTTNVDGAGVALSTSQTYVSQVFETKPGGGAWTEANVNAAEFGVTVTA